MMQSNSTEFPKGPSNAAIERLNVFVGTWSTQITSMSFDPDPSAVVRGRTSFDWLEAGAFLIQRSEVSDPRFPRPVAIIGADDAAETYGMLYFDSRGVSRIYQMSLQGNVWKLWRDFPDFPQRFIGTFSDDRNTITARWERSSDGSNWELDFNLTYIRIG